MIPVTRPYLPSREKLNKYIDGIYERQWLTNNGQLVQELTRRLEDHLGVENLLLVSNGTLALQIAYRTLGINKMVNGKPAQAITTPFTFVATASSLKWDGVQPVFADIDPQTWCLSPENIEAEITPQTSAIVPVHVFGNACNVEALGDIAQKHNLKVIYDASHAFGVTYKSESLLKHGDAATLSFHATKLFHTGEGGAIVFKRKEDLERAKKMINFGITGPETIEELGINAKMNELQAAMGLCVLDEIDILKTERKRIWCAYKQELTSYLQLQQWNPQSKNNYAYAPVLLENEAQLLKVESRLKENNILPRRYFYPSLDGLADLKNKDNQEGIKNPETIQNSELKNWYSHDIASRILCLPIYSGLGVSQQELIIKILKS
jgi:dTDP-4-amino-4,6-dideoxygalactose transaminase